MSLASKLAGMLGAIGNQLDPSFGGAPSGVVLPFAGAAAPTGWLLCYGQAVSRTTYNNLFVAIGTLYGAGDGSTTFNVPDMRGRVMAGKDNMGGTAASRLTTAAGGVDGVTLGATGGSATNTLTTAHMPAHNHGVNDPGHAHAASQDDHTHSTTGLATGRGTGYGLTNASAGFTDRVPIFPSSSTTNTPTTSGASVGGVYITGNITSITTANNGSGVAHPLTQPTVILNTIIKT